MVLAQREHRDVPDQDEFFVTRLKRGGEDVFRIDPQPGEELGI
jgi:hypothetical protein